MARFDTTSTQSEITFIQKPPINSQIADARGRQASYEYQAWFEDLVRSIRSLQSGGTVGSQGVTGVPGSIGPSGPIGPIGPQGVQGIQGIQGVTGTQGTTGTFSGTLHVDGGAACTKYLPIEHVDGGGACW